MIRECLNKIRDFGILEFSVFINYDKYVDYVLKCVIDIIMLNKKCWELNSICILL